MDSFTFCTPTHYAYGDDQEATTGQLIRKFGGSKVLLVYGGGSIKRSGLYDSITKSMKDAGLSWVELDGIQANPRSGKVEEGIELCRKEGVDFLLAVGGGSVMDTAKTIGFSVPYDGYFWDFFDGSAAPQDTLPVGIVSTLSATGSEGSDNTVITLEKGNLKWPSFKNDTVRPTFVVFAPKYTCTLPAYQTACGIVDMMTHVMERYFSNTKNVQLTDELGEAVMRAIINAGKRVMANPDDVDARGDLQWASVLAHNGLCSTGREMDWASHQIEHELSAFYDCAHGAGLAVVMPAWMEYTMSHDIERYVQYAHKVFDIAINEADPVETAKAGITATREFFKSLDMPATLADLNANVDDIPAMVAHRGEKPGGFPFGKFVIINPEEMEAILRLCIG